MTQMTGDGTTSDDSVIVIGKLGDADSHDLRLQDFVVGGHAFFPIFSSVEAFKAQTSGSGHEASGIVIDRELLISILRGDEVLVLDPGGPRPLRLTKADLAGPPGRLKELRAG